jgi:hypothetical protein
MRRFIKPTAIVAAVLVAVFTVWSFIDRYQADIVQQFIESRYVNEIQQLETAMLARSREQHPDPAIWQETTDALRAVFDASEIFEVGWSIDGHHGMNSIKIMPTGFTIHRPFFSFADYSHVHHQLFYGESFQGEPLFIYQGWLPQAQVKHDYDIVFYADQIRTLMKALK